MGVSLSVSIKENSQNIANNTTNVTVTATLDYDNYSHNATGECYGYITIDGVDYDDFADITFNSSQSKSGSKVVMTKTVNVKHNNDGTKNLSCYAWLWVNISSAKEVDDSASKTLTTIPRKSTLSTGSGSLGEEQTLTITAPSDSFTHTITYECGDESGTVVTKTKEKSITWTPPLSLASANTTGASVTAFLTLTTYSGNTEVGTHEISVFYTIGSALAPTFTVDFSDDAGYEDIYGDFIQLQSKLKIIVNPTTLYGATVKMCKISVNGETFNDLEAVAREIDLYGDIHVYVLVQDSRGKIAQEHLYVRFREYSLPRIPLLTVKRCNSDGTSNDQGEYVQVTYSANVTSLGDKNTAVYKLEYKKSTDSVFTTVNLPQFTNDFFISDETYRFAADTGSSYNIQLTVTDAFGSVVKTTLASTAATIMHFPSKGNGIGLGKVCETENAIDIGWNIQMNKHSIKNIADPEDDSDPVTKAFLASYLEEYMKEHDISFSKIYPIGSIYLAYNGEEPATLFGGKWERMSNALLYSSSEVFPAGSEFGFGVSEIADYYWNAVAIDVWRRTE